MKISILFILSVLITYPAYSQTASYGILLSNKDEVLIQDGDHAPTKWGVNPAIQLDVYTSNQIGKIVTY